MLMIPFAIDHSSGELVEVGQVRSGRSCGCACPSCGQSVIARQGEVNQWHFAHDSKGKEPPKSLCDISFYVCCKRFVIEQLIKNKTLTLSTPGYSVSEKQLMTSGGSFKSKTASMVVTGEKVLTVDGFTKDSNYDLTVLIGSHSIDVILDHPERSLANICPGTNAILSVDLRYIAKRYNEVRSAPGLIQQAVIELFSIDVTHKHWIFHPREVSMRARLLEQLNSEQGNPETVEKRSYSAPITEPQNVRCTMCNTNWRWMTGEPYSCITCDTHLYIVSEK
jgi:hypothetical protein